MREIALQHLVKFRSGQDYKDVVADGGSVPVIGSGGPFATASAYLHDGESVLFGRKGTIDRPMHVNGKFWTVDTMFYTELGPLVHGRWLYYWATTLPFGLYSTDTALPSMTSSSLGRLKLPFIPKEQQRRIADYLDQETGEIDTMIAKMDDLAGQLEERRWRGVDAAFEAISKTAPLWMFTDGVIDCPHTTPTPDDAGPAEAVRTASIRGGKFLPGNGIRVSEETQIQRNGEFPPRLGDIFFTREAPAGEAALVPDGMLCLGQRMVLLRVNGTIVDSRYLLYALYTSAVQEEFRLSAGGSTVVNLKLGTIRSTQIPYVSLEDQKRIADHLDEVTSRIDAMLTKVAELKSLLIERRAALITEVVTGRKEVA